MGDFNIDMRYAPVKCGKRFDKLEEIGMRHIDAIPSTNYSYFPPTGSEGTRLDHAFLSRHFLYARAKYISEEDGYVFASKQPGAMSDHAVLIVDATLEKTVV
jgi:hypothetical protein